MTSVFYAGQKDYIEKLNALSLAESIVDIPANKAAAEASALAASVSATSAANSQGVATTKASEAVTSATTAVNQVAIIGTAATIQGLANTATTQAGIATNQANLATTNGAAQVTLAAIEKTAAQSAKTAAEAAQALSQAASIASTLSLAAKDTIALGRASVADGATFWVRPNTVDNLSRYTNYLRVNSSTQSFIADQVIGTEFDNSIPSLIAITASLAPIRTNQIVKTGVESTSVGSSVTPGVSFGLGQSANAGSLSEVKINIAALGSGIIVLCILSGTFPNLTVKKKINIVASSTGINTFNTSSLGVVEIVAGDYIVAYSPSGGITASYVAGNYAIFRLSGEPTGTQTWSSGGYSYQCSFSVVVRGVAVPDAALSSDTQQAFTAIKSVVLNPVVSSFGNNPITASGSEFGSNNSFTVGQSTASGVLASVQISVTVLNSGSATILVLNGTAPNFTVTQAIPVTLSSVGVNLLSSANFGVVNIVSGNTVAIFFSAGGPTGVFNNGTSTLQYFKLSGQPTGTQSWQSGAGYTYSGYATVQNKTVQIGVGNLAGDLSSVITAKADQKSVLHAVTPYEKYFIDAAPVGWALGSGWSGSVSGMLSPVGVGDFSQQTKLTNIRQFRDDQRTHRIEFSVPSTGSRFAFGSYINFGHPSLVQVDTVNALLKFHAAGTEWTTEPAVIASVSIPALIINRKYALEVEKNRRVMSVRLIDMVTGTTLATMAQGADADTTFPSVGNLHGSPVFINRDGQVNITLFRVTSKNGKPRAMFIGDSKTEASFIKITDGWAYKCRTATGNSSAIGAIFGGNSSEILRVIDFDLPSIKPDWVVEFYGTNDTDTGLATVQSSINALISYCSTNSVKLAVGILPQRGPGGDSRTFSAINTWLLALPPSIRKIRFDLAVSTNNDGVTYNAANYTDWLHENAVGNELMYQRMLIDLPEIFY